MASLKKNLRMSLLGGINEFITHFYNFNKHAGMILFDIEKPYDTGLVTYFIRLSHFVYMIIFSFFKSYFKDKNLLSTSIALISPPKLTFTCLLQGALLSTTLFSIYLSDMPHPALTNLSQTQLFYSSSGFRILSPAEPVKL